MTVSATLTARLAAVQAGGNSFSDRFQPTLELVQKFTDGTGANQADLLYADERTVSDGANDDIDLAGVLSDAFGSTLTFAELVGMVLINKPLSGSNTTDLTVGGGSNPFVGFLGGTTPTIGPLKPGAALMLFAGDAAGIGTVTASTADILRIANSAGAANTYQIALLGRSA